MSQYTILDDKNIIFKLDFTTGFPFLHLELPNGCSLSMYKYLKNKLLEDTLELLGVLGYEVAFTCIPEGDDKLLKFQKLMGFEEERREHGKIYLAQDII